MNNRIYWRLALQSLKKNYRITLPFLGGSILMAAFLFSLRSLILFSGQCIYKGCRIMNALLADGYPILELFGCLFFLYLNNVLQKNRQRENGLFHLLGLERAHLLRILFYQFLVLYGLTILFGFLGGLVMQKVMTLLAARLLDQPAVLGLNFQPQALISMILIIGFYYLLIGAFSAFNLLKTKPIDLLHGSSQPQSAPKGQKLITLLGILCLGGGYWIALSTSSASIVVLNFMIAVILVIIGTYCLFLGGIETFLNALQKNSNYYYKPNHFVSLSLMKYRLRANAASLANIAILSCMVLTALSCSISLFGLIDTQVSQNIQADAKLQLWLYSDDPTNVDAHLPDLEKAIYQSMDQAEIPFKNLAIGIPLNRVHTDDDQSLWLISEDRYEKATGERLNLKDDEIYTLANNGIDGPVAAAGKTLYPTSVQSTTLNLTPYSNRASKPDSLIGVISSLKPLINPDAGVLIQADFDLDPAFETTIDQAELESMISSGLDLGEISDRPGSLAHSVVINVATRRDHSAMDKATYSGLLFIGIYVSLAFILFIILIMYYKQISEGFEDQKRFAIMQNVGLESRQIRKIINDQVLLLFFAPLSVAAVHMAFAFPIIETILGAFFDASGKFIAPVMIWAFLIFAASYVVIYRLTARTYFRITCKR